MFLPWHKVWLSKEFFYYLDFALMKEIWWCPFYTNSNILLCQIIVLQTVLLYTSFRLYVLFKKFEYLFLVYCPSSKSCCIPVCEASIQMTISLMWLENVKYVSFLFSFLSSAISFYIIVNNLYNILYILWVIKNF